MSSSMRSSESSTLTASSYSSSSYSSSSNSSGGIPGPAWDWGAVFGRDQESQFLQSLVQTNNNNHNNKKNNQSSAESTHDQTHKDPGPSAPQPTPSATTTTTTTTTVLLHGAAGSGKSSLVLAQQSWYEQQGWVLATGKFMANQEQFQEPFSALIEACNQLIEAWMRRNDTSSVCQLGGFQSLLDDDVEFLRHILPKAYQAVQARTAACPCASSTTISSSSSSSSYSSPFKDDMTAETSLEEEAETAEENAVLDQIPPVVPEAAAATADDAHNQNNNNTNRRIKKHRNSSFCMKQNVCSIDCVNASFVRILAFLCQAQPVVMFLDDVQWADAASAKVLQVLATTESLVDHKFVLILSYRDEEMTSSDETKLISKNDPPSQPPQRRIYDMPITNLTVDGVNALIASLTRRAEDETLALAHVVHQKTAGNPFFVTQFLQMLRREQFLRYAYLTTGHWEWGQVDQLQSAAHVSDNVADLVAASLERLPESTRMALKVAACLGKVIPLHVLMQWFDHYVAEATANMGDNGSNNTAVGSTTSTSCYQALHQVQLQGLQSVLDHAVEVGILIRPKGQDAYMWAHDKLQAVAYSLIPPRYRPVLHLKLGRTLWQMSQEEYPDEEWMVFMAADQMNRYSELVQQEQQNELLDDDSKQNHETTTEVLGAEVATLCLEAARLSLAKSALYPAYDMLKAGVKHLNVPNKWKNHYDLCLNLYSTVAELSVQLGENQQSMEAVHEVEAHARSFQDKFRVQMVHLKLITEGQDRNFQLGLETATEILKEYGVRMPIKLLPGMLTLECNKLRRRLPGGTLQGLLELPDLTDKKSRNTIKLLVTQSLFALLSQKKSLKQLSWYAALRVLSITVDRKAVAEETAMAIGTLGMSHGAQGQFKEANEYGELALQLMDRFPQTVGSMHALVTISVTSGIFIHTKPLNKCLDLWLEAHHIGLRTGNTEKAGAAVLGYAFTYITCGLPLGPLQSDLYQYEKEVVQFNLAGTIRANFQIFEQFILNLQQEPPSSDPTMLKGEAMDQDKMLASFQGNAHRMTKRDIDTFRLLLAVIYGKWDTAEHLIGELEPSLDTDHFYVRSSMRGSTMALAAFHISRSNGKRKLRQMARKILKEFRDALKKGNVNALPLHTMLNAEESPSKEKYEHAIRSCARLGLIHFEAYMCERAGLYFLQDTGEVPKDEEWAEFYLAQAVTLYADWGAHGKAQQLRTDHVRLLRSSLVRERANTALKGRSRYSSTHTDLLMDFEFERLSTNSINASSSLLLSSSSSSSSSSSLLTKSASSSNSSSNMALAQSTSRDRSGKNTRSNTSKTHSNKKHTTDDADETMTSTTEDSSEHDDSNNGSSSDFAMGDFVYTSPLS
ncbi:hypothetical protein ACA910_006332 [Epithemia clementina (nom. ined.)]